MKTASPDTQLIMGEINSFLLAVQELDLGDVTPPKQNLLNVAEAAKYTGRSRRTFDRELRQGIWSCIRIGGTGHPKFLKEDLDADMAAWKQLGKFRKRVKA